MKFFTFLALPLAISATSRFVNRAEGDSLHKFIKAAGKQYFGNIAEKGKLSNSQYAATMKKDFGQVTCESSMKWNNTQFVRGKFTWDAADAVVNWAVENNFSIRGHALLWYRHIPDWLDRITDKKELQEAIETHISTVMGRWKGKIRAWDVVNEVFDENKGNAFRQDVFHRVLGEEYIGIAFRAARKADPAAKLYINDYGIDNANSPKHIALLSHVKKWKNAGIPIDGIGSQTHLGPGQSDPVANSLKQLATAGVEVAITEIDIENANPHDYRVAVNACVDVPQCVGVTGWGLRDKDSFTPNRFPLMYKNDATPEGTPFVPKDAYYAVRDYLKSAKKN